MVHRQYTGPVSHRTVVSRPSQENAAPVGSVGTTELGPHATKVGRRSWRGAGQWTRNHIPGHGVRVLGAASGRVDDAWRRRTPEWGSVARE